MAFNIKKNETKRDFMDLAAVEAVVDHVRVVSESFVSFTLKCKGFSLYNMKYIDSNGKRFIAPPSQKGKNGEYYNLYSVYFTPDDEKWIMSEIEAKLDET